MKKLLICTYLMVIMIISVACWDAKQLEDLSIVSGLGVDLTSPPEEILLTVQLIDASKAGGNPGGQGGSGEGGEAAVQVTSNTGYSLFDAVRKFSRHVSNRLYFPHNQIIVFGKDVASTGIWPFLDFFLRDHETRSTVWILITEQTAQEVLNAQIVREDLPAVAIEDMIEASSARSHTLGITLQRLLEQLMSKTTAPIAPHIKVVEEGGKPTLLLSGLAVFKRDKLAGLLTEDETRGLLWVLGEVGGGIIVVECSSDSSKAELEILNTTTKLNVEFINNSPIIQVNIKIESNLGSQMCVAKAPTPSAMRQLEQLQAEAIKTELHSALVKAQELNADIFGFGELIKRSDLKKWRALESQWDQIFPNMQIDINVKSTVRRIGLISSTGPPQ